MLEKFLVFSTKAFRKPWVFIVLAAAIAVVFGLGIPKLVFDNDIKSMIPETNHDRMVFNYYEDEGRFGSSDMIFVGVETDDIYSEKNLAYVKTLQDEIDGLNNVLPARAMAKLLGLSREEGHTVITALRGVGINRGNYTETLVPLLTSTNKLESQFSWDRPFAERVAAAARRADPSRLYASYENPIDKTQSLINADYIANEDDALVVKKLMGDASNFSAESVAGLRQRVSSWEIYQDALVSRDGKLSMILVKPNTRDSEAQVNLTSAVEQILHTHADPAFRTYLDGETVINTMISRSMFTDTKFLLPLAAGLILLILWLCFRDLRGVTYPAAIVLVAVIFTMGLMAYCRVPVSIVGTAVPVLLVAIVAAYGIHQMNHFMMDSQTDKLAILERNMKNVGLAITLSAITVMVGFGALAVEDFVPIKNFGIFVAIGDMLGAIAALYLLPSLILASRKPKTRVTREASTGVIAAILRFFVRINRKHARLVLVVTAVLVAIFLVGSLQIKSELNNVSFFRKGSSIHRADDYLNEMLAGTEVLSVVLDSDLSDPARRSNEAASGEVIDIATPAVLDKIEDFDRDVRKEFPFAAKVLSFNTVIKKMNQEMNGGDASFYSIPQSKDLIGQYLLTFSGDIKSIISTNHDRMRISITMKRVPTTEVERVRQYCGSYFSKDFLAANHLQVQVTGTAHLYNVANTLLVDGMIRSMVVCIVIVFSLLILVLRNLRMSLIAITPIVGATIINFGALGIFGIPLNIGTAIVSSVTIGIGVDFSIHFITWYRNELRRKADIGEALENSIVHKGRAILYNMFVIFGGFIVFVFSQFVPLVQFGALVAACMVLTAVGALVVVPAIIKVLARRDFPFLYLGMKKEASGLH